MDKERIRIVTPFVGGGFGSKLGIHSETILAALAARELKQPVKVVMTRQQIFQLLGCRPVTSQRVRLGARRDGRMVALGHDVTMHTSILSEYAEQTASSARPMYAAPGIGLPSSTCRAARMSAPRARRRGSLRSSRR
jgi:xanthine dehydrogenase YagR molybdenum-binding subunit